MMMKKWMKYVLAFVLVFSIGCSTDQGSYVTITMDEAMEVFAQSGDYIILDVRTQEEYEQGHIEGAICIPNETISDQPLDQLPDLNQKIYVYCRSGNRSKQASEKLVSIGYTNIIECGGINDWNGDVVTGSNTVSQIDEQMKDVLVGTWQSEDGRYVMEIEKQTMYEGVLRKNDIKIFEGQFTLNYQESTEDAVVVYEFEGFDGDLLDDDCNNFNSLKSVFLTEENDEYQLFMHLSFTQNAETVYLYQAK